ncbi:MAG TPA: malate synthase A [Gammaproteobacteria bacterium]
MQQLPQEDVASYLRQARLPSAGFDEAGRIEIHGEIHEKGRAYDDVLTPAALEFVLSLHRNFTPRLRKLLEARQERQFEFDAGLLPGFDSTTAEIRRGQWKIAGVPADLLDRRVEITGPAERKMIINALNSGAKVFMADLEDSLSPTFDNVMSAQRDLRDAVRHEISLTSGGKHYTLNETTAQLIVRPRGLHLSEKHMKVDGEVIPAALVDFGLYAFHNLNERLARGTGLYLYLPKIEHWHEADWWASVFRFTEDTFKVERGSIKATVLIETLPAVFQMDEILFALREYIVGLNCGRWDYIFSFIKTFRAHADRVLPDRAQVGMTQPFLRAYSQLLIQTCHKRGAFAMGGMAAQIPIKGDAAANARALDAVRNDKQREADDGHDGTWVAHPALVPVAMEIFDKKLRGANQLDVLCDDVNVSADDLIAQPEGDITLDGVCGNVKVALDYLAAWFAGRGCVPLNHLMEDAATAEIARTQLWQWIHHPSGVCRLGHRITASLVDGYIDHVLRERLKNADGTAEHYEDAAALLRELVFNDELADFLTLPAYEQI